MVDHLNELQHEGTMNTKTHEGEGGPIDNFNMVLIEHGLRRMLNG
jgi:hypothetical protein